jgi:uncharacterized protein (TIGR02145 family)
MCHNLGASNTSADPFTPSWEINGGYWQWGRKAQAAAGPTGPSAVEANEVAVNGWNTSNAPDGSWLDVFKLATDPCPAGYRVPTKIHWDGVAINNTITNLGTWSTGYTNYSSGKKFGSELMLPTAGLRLSEDGLLEYRGTNGYYWSSTQNATGNALLLHLSSGGAWTFGAVHRYGFSVRCISE